jgi:hypothetical protein
MRNNDQSENDIMSRAVYSLYSIVRQSQRRLDYFGLGFIFGLSLPILLALAQGERKLN